MSWAWTYDFLKYFLEPVVFTEILYMFFQCYVMIMSHTHFRVNLNLIVPECQETPCLKQAQYLKFKWQQVIWTLKLSVCKRRLSHLAKLAMWLSCVVSTYPYGAFISMLLSYHVRMYMMLTYSQMFCMNKYSQQLSHFVRLGKWLSVCLSGWVLHELSSCGFESRYVLYISHFYILGVTSFAISTITEQML